jgi:hypothetical protein
MDKSTELEIAKEELEWRKAVSGDLRMLADRTYGLKVAVGALATMCAIVAVTLFIYVIYKGH